MDDNISAERDERPEDTEHITVTFPLKDDRADAADLFFRIEEGQGEGSGKTPYLAGRVANLPRVSSPTFGIRHLGKI